MECLLEQKAKVNAKNIMSKTPLHLLVSRGIGNEEAQLRCIEMLMKYKANIDAKDLTLMTPLHYAAKNSVYSSTIEKLLDYKANIHSVNKLGFTPLLLAASSNNSSIVKFLTKSGANISDKNKSNETALHLVALRSTYPIDKILEDNIDINVLSVKNKTALDYILEAIPTERHLVNYRENARFLVEHVLKLHNMDVYVSKENLLGIDKFLKLFGNLKATEKSDIVLFKEECEREGILLKQSKIGDSNITYYKLFKKSTHQLAQYLVNKNVLQETQPVNYKEKFPIYSDLITKNLERGLERKEILDQDTHGFVKETFYNLPDNCVDEILSYLENRDLQALMNANKIKLDTNIFSPMLT